MARYTQKDTSDVPSSIINTTGDATISTTTLGGATTVLSSQVIVLVSGGGGGWLDFQRSNDGTNWDNLQASINITVDTTTWFEDIDPTYRDYRITVSGGTGGLDIQNNTNIRGDFS